MSGKRVGVGIALRLPGTGSRSRAAGATTVAVLAEGPGGPAAEIVRLAV